jgi:hypothetical protein
MTTWLSDVPEQYRERIGTLFSDAANDTEKVEVLSKWHPEGHVNLRPIKTLEEYFRFVRITSGPQSWFRGEEKDFGHLVPKLYRNLTQENVESALKKERTFYQEFRRRARMLAPQISPDDDWGWYFLIQHYGGPTRLLDWTQDAAMALFFALDTCKNEEDTPIVYVLAPAALTTFATAEVTGDLAMGGKVYYPQEAFAQPWAGNVRVESPGTYGSIPNSPVPLFPPHLDQRMEAQKSCFTLFGRRIHGFDGTPHAARFSVLSDPDVAGIAALRPSLIVCPCCGRRLVNKIIIDGGSCAALKGELARMGMTSARAFPGLEGLCRELADVQG